MGIFTNLRSHNNNASGGASSTESSPTKSGDSPETKVKKEDGVQTTKIYANDLSMNGDGTILYPGFENINQPEPSLFQVSIWYDLEIVQKNYSGDVLQIMKTHFNSNIRSLDIHFGSFTINETVIGAICHAIQHFVNFSSLKIHINGSIPVDVLKMLLDAYASPKDDSLSLREDKLELDVAGFDMDACKLMYQMIPRLNNLHVLTFRNVWNVKFWSDILDGCFMNTSLSRLKLISCKLLPRNSYSIGAGLASNTTLQGLYISKTDISNIDFHYIAEGLGENRHLEKLKLHETNLTTCELFILGMELERNQSLYRIKLSNNRIDPDVMEYIDHNQNLSRISRIKRFASEGYACIKRYQRRNFHPSPSEINQYQTDPISSENAPFNDVDSQASEEEGLLDMDFHEYFQPNQLDYFEQLGGYDSEMDH